MSFLISSRKNFERDALSEAYYVISDLLNYKIRPLKSRIPGLSLLELLDSNIDPFKVITDIRSYIKEKGILIACLKIIPIQKLIKTDLNRITAIAVSLTQNKILPSHSWKINIRKRQTNLRTLQIVENIAKEINWGKVDLTSPDFEIRIEIVRDLTGISVMEPHFELSMPRISRNPL